MILRLSLYLLLLLSLTGCGNQDLAPTPIDKDTGVYTPTSTPLPPAVAPAPADPLAGAGPLAPSDPLASSDPLAGDQSGLPTSVPIAADDDPLSSEPKMPTDHSHWLHGDISDAQVMVRLDGRPLGTFEGPVDKDITMRLRRGMNTISFTYTPQGSLATARLQVLESEHDPPIPPLATFRNTVPTEGQMAQTESQSFTFIAR